MLPFPLRKAWKRQLATISTQRKVFQSTPCTHRGAAFECGRKTWSLLVLFPPLITPQHQGCCRGHCLKSALVAPCPWGQTLGLCIISCSANYTLLFSCHWGFFRVQQDLGVLKGKTEKWKNTIQLQIRECWANGIFPQQPVTISLNAQFGIHLVVKWDATPLTRIISTCW